MFAIRAQSSETKVEVRLPKLLGGRVTLLLAAKEPHDITLVSCNRSQCTALRSSWHDRFRSLHFGPSAKNLFQVLVTRNTLPRPPPTPSKQSRLHHDERRKNRGEGAPPLQHRTHQVILPISCIPGLAGWFSIDLPRTMSNSVAGRNMSA